MKKILLLTFILLFCTLSFAQKKEPGQPTPTTALPFQLRNFIRDWVQPTVVYAFNSSGASMTQGFVVIWDNVFTKIDSIELDGTGNDTLTIADSLKTYRWWQLRLKTLNAASNCSLYVSGLDSANAVQVETLAINGAADLVVWSVNKWRKLNMLYAYGHAANDTFVVYGVPYMCVTTTTTEASTNVAGVAYETAADDSIVKVVINGYFQAYVLGSTEITPGTYIETGTTLGYGIADATPVAGKGLGTALESGNTDKLYWINVNPAY